MDEKLDDEFITPELDSEARNLKKKYYRSDLKVRNGEVLNPCHQKLYELSKKVWGCGGGKDDCG